MSLAAHPSALDSKVPTTTTTPPGWKFRGPSLRDPRVHNSLVLLSIHVLGQTAIKWDLSIAQIAICYLTCGLMELAIVAYRDHTIAWPASALLTGNGVALLLRIPGTEHGDWWSLRGGWIFFAVSIGSLLSKYLIRWRGRQVFNPSNLGLVLCFWILGSGRVEPQDLWWGPPFAWPTLACSAILIVGGVAVTRRLGLLGLALSFWAVFALGAATLGLSGHAMSARWHLGPVEGSTYGWIVGMSPEILIFMFFMVTDPKTVPTDRRQRILFGGAVGLLAIGIGAAQSTEFATKVGLLSALTIVSAARPIVATIAERRAWTTWDAPRLALVPTRGAFAGGILVAALVSGSVVSISRFVPGAGLDRSERRVVSTTDLPSVAVDKEVTAELSGIDHDTATTMVADLVAALGAEEEALRVADPAIAAPFVTDQRLQALRKAVGNLVDGDPVTVINHDLDRATVVLVGGRPSPQSLPVLGIAVEGHTSAVTWLRGRETQRAEPQPFAATFVLGQRDGRFILAGDTAGGALPAIEVPTIPWEDVAEGLHFGTVVDEGSQPGQLPLFDDVTDAAGLRFDTGTLHGESLPEPSDGYWEQASVFDLLNGAEAYYGTGQAWADVDGDGVLDLFLTDQTGPNRLFLGTSEGTFEPAPAALADPPSLSAGGSGTASFVDVDNGGRPWLLVLTTDGPRLYRNDGGRALVDVTDASGLDDDGKGFGAGWADFDRDGLLDLFIANYGCQPCSLQNRPPFGLGQGRLFHNVGGGRFEDATDALGGGQGVQSKAFLGTWTDYDDDGDPDLLIVNDTRAFVAQPDRDEANDELPEGIAPGNALLRNDGPGCEIWCFTDVTIEAGAGQRADFMGAAVGDFSGSGRPDVFLTNTGIIGSPTALLVNNGTGYDDLAAARGANLGEWTWGANALDVDNDGRLDVFTSVGFSDALLMRRIGMTRGDPSTGAERRAILAGETNLPTEAIRAPFPVADDAERRTDNNRVLRQNDDGSFEVVTVGASDLQPPPHYGNAVADFDNDGWPDVVSGSLGQGYALLHNRAETGAGNHRIGFDLRGDGQRVNRDAVGARVRVTDSSGVVRTAWVRLETGSDRRVLIGLGSATAVRAEIGWPDGTTKQVDDPQTDHVATIESSTGVASWTPFRAP